MTRHSRQGRPGTRLLNLDTHIVLHALGGSVRPRERKLLEANTWSMSAIVVWEIAKLVQLGRVTLDLDAADTVRALKSIKVWPGRASTR